MAGIAANSLEEDWGKKLLEAGRRNENLAAIRKSKMSEAFERAQMFEGHDKGLAWAGALGSLTAQISSVVLLNGPGAVLGKGAQLLGAGAKASRIASMTPTIGTMSAYAAAMTNEEAKEMGLEESSRLKLYGLIFATSLATETMVSKILGGKNVLESGLGLINYEKDAAVKAGTRKALAESGLFEAIESGATDTKAAGNIVATIFDKLGGLRKGVSGKLEGSKIGRAINSGAEEGMEEFTQGILEGSSKMLIRLYELWEATREER